MEIIIDIFYGGEALIDSIKENGNYDLIFLDIELGKINGVEIGHIIREDMEDYVTKIIYISSKSGYDRQLFEVQPLHFLQKPLDEEKVLKDVLLALKILGKENQVFELQDDDYVSSLAEDIKNNGLDNALIVRKLDNNKYDLICGRHRLLALKKLDETKIPCIIQNLSDDESEIKLINSNLNQRHNYKLSELAKAYKIKKEILQKKYKNSLDTVSNREKFNVYEELAKDTSYSSKTIERYIKINYLIDEFKKLVDEKKLTTEKYQALTKFSELEQRHLYNFLNFNKLSFSKLNKKKIDKLLELGLSDENLEKCN